MQQLLPDLVACADEPIRVPGAIQPHGWMLVVDASRHLVAYSGNLGDAVRARAVLERLDGINLARLVASEPPAAMGSVDIDGVPHDVLAHRLEQYFILELEPAAPVTGTQAPLYGLARTFLPRLQGVSSVEALSALAADEMKRLTGFGRCLVYRFDAEGHGEVLAQAIDEGYESYEGHHFPAADIPAQARELYRLNHIRVIPDARYGPAALVGVVPGFDPRGIDLSWATLRSVSPIHLEYMVNMGTLASMSVSIMVRGKLWGLISCHNHGPLPLSQPVRAACEHLGQLLSLQIEAKEDNAEVAERLELRKLTLEIVAHLAESDATLQKLTTTQLLRLAQAGGAAVVLDEQSWAVGDTPPHETMRALADWVAASGQSVFRSERVGEEMPGAAAFPGLPAGLLAISISQVHRHLVMWFRPEHIHTIQWAGDPRKEVRGTDGRIHPRRSFVSWRQQVRGVSAPWTPAQLITAGELRQALIGIVLRRAQEMAEFATELSRVNKELEAFSYTVSHDLRAPMRHIAGYVDLVLDLEGKNLSERALRYLAHVKEASAFAGHLVDALLDFSRMGRAELKRKPVDTQTMVEDLVREFERHESDGRASWEIDGPLPKLQADPILLQVAVRNLLDNAAKYSRGRDHPVIRISALREPGSSGLQVADNGVGFQMKYANKLFGVFQRLHQAEEFEGTGIGLATTKRIVERHGGSVHADGEVGKGATFGFLLPDVPSPQRHDPMKDTA
ncbi:ATP-binding protein [Caenimonas aquaedulcis]|uniref:histidine kinase n=1 Tax=Caenimonas aquaedulcis TaxID=2793270 RepID=A0A931H3A2_9BURK|nr:ATP-binding protein [Caenimonas aquaedulcis]MBG9387713.1 GAF domain-containing protein [Caenimonas aquaedulcis]